MSKQKTEVYIIGNAKHQLFRTEVAGVHEREILLRKWK
jgi:hypothetical protein